MKHPKNTLACRRRQQGWPCVIGPAQVVFSIRCMNASKSSGDSVTCDREHCEQVEQIYHEIHELTAIGPLVPTVASDSSLVAATRDQGCQQMGLARGCRTSSSRAWASVPGRSEHEDFLASH